MFVVKGIISFLQLSLQAEVTSEIISNSRLSLLQDITSMDYKGFTKTDSGTIQNISTLEVNRLQNALQHYLNTLQYVVMAVIYIILSIFADWSFALMILVSSFILLFFYNKLIKYFKKLSSTISKKGNKYHSYLTQLLHHYKYLKTTETVNYYNKRIVSEIKETEILSLKFWRINAITNSIREPMILLIVGAVITIQYIMSGSVTTYIIYSLLLFYRTLNYIILAQNNRQNFHQYSGSIDNIVTTQSSIRSYGEVYNENPEIVFNDQIQLIDLSLDLDGRNILSGINLIIKKNTTTALIGPSGAGKSTLASVISGLFKPDSGIITLDKTPYNKFDIRSLRKKIGYVSQDYVVFNDSFFNNVTMWAEKTTENSNRFSSVIFMAGLKETINGHSDKENTMLGDSGVLLSGGQKQRLSIARELFRGTEIIIFDEATSSLDSQTEAVIQQNIAKLAGHVTIIIIAHRFSTIKSADQIVLIDRGKIDASGTFNELMSGSTKFREMLELQKF